VKLKPLPEEVRLCLPQDGPILRSVEWAYQTTDADPFFHIATILPTFASLVNLRGVVDPFGESFNIVAQIVGQAASSKSTAIRRSTRLWKRVAEACNIQHPMRVEADGTTAGLIEALSESFEGQQNRVIATLVSEEVSTLLRSTKHSANMPEFLCKLFDGIDVTRHLRTVKAANRAKSNSMAETLRNPAICGIFASTFSSMALVAQNSFEEAGLFSRQIYTVGTEGLVPHSMAYHPRPKMLDAVILDYWQPWDRWAVQLPVLQGAYPVPCEELSEEVENILHDTLFQQLKDPNKSESVSMRKRALEHAKRVAYLYALSQHRLSVRSEDMDAAVNLLQLSLNHYRRLRKHLRGDSIYQLATRAFQVIADNGAGKGIGRSKLYPRLSCARKTMDEVLDTLADEGSIEVRRMKSRGCKGYTEMYFAVAPERHAAPLASWVSKIPASTWGGDENDA